MVHNRLYVGRRLSIRLSEAGAARASQCVLCRVRKGPSGGLAGASKELIVAALCSGLPLPFNFRRGAEIPLSESFTLQA